MRRGVARWLVILFIATGYGCHVYSMVVLENQDFPDTVSPKDASPKILDKYSVGDVIVWPRIFFFDGRQTKYQLDIAFYSKATSSSVSIKSLDLKVNDERLEYGDEMVDAPASGWSTGVSIEPFYVCGIAGGPIDRPKSEMVESEVDVSLLVVVKGENGLMAEKRISSHFLPKKRSFIE